ncbi:hypothetical protein DFJ73DRAFT_826853 [Zopfochytrium polystomum]|nr:hypothetical protein DFJ73DRAFT_826853 [Zopfochytrium polystomum]
MSLILPRRAFTSGPSVECRVPATLETEFLRRDRPQRVFRLSRPRRQFAKADVSNFYDDLLRVSPHKPWNLDEFKQQLEEVRSLKEGPAKLEAINRLYNSVASRFTVYKSLLAEIQREYALILESGMNQRSEREYLLTKIRKLMGETLDEATLKNETERLEALEAEVRRIAKQSKRIRERAKEEDCFFLKTIGDIFVKESESSHDTRRRGKKTFIQEWLVKNLSNEKVVAHGNRPGGFSVGTQSKAHNLHRATQNVGKRGF